MHASLLDCGMPIFQALNRLMQERAEGELYGAMLRQLIYQFEREAFECQMPAHQVHDAKYALAALIDECMLKYAPNENWITQLLQVEQFGEHLAGEHFFQWLDKVKQTGPTSLPVLEVYYVCLKMGFSGRYALEGAEKLNAIHVDVKHTLDTWSGTCDPRLSPRLSLPSPLHFMKRSFPWWGYGAASFACILFMRIAYQLMLSGVTA